MSETLDDRVRAYARHKGISMAAARDLLISIGLAAHTNEHTPREAYVEDINIGVLFALSRLEGNITYAVQGAVDSLRRLVDTQDVPRQQESATVVSFDRARAGR